jgi:3-dehydroquinate dehydratase-2
MKILVINGPNLNLLGVREPEIYGKESLKDIEEMLFEYCSERGDYVRFFQSNHEGAIIDAIQEAAGTVDGIVINPGAYSHYSYAIRDAISSVSIPTVEVHISNIYAREDFRKICVIKDVCIGQICGRGTKGYRDAIDLIAEHIA